MYKSSLKRYLDFLFALIGLILVTPIMLVIGVLISIESAGGAIYSQERIGLNGQPFKLFKLRSMKVVNTDNKHLTVGKDPRITKIGSFIRKFKIDELPQLWNVLIGNMSIVGPRPEVKKFVKLYSEEQMLILKVRPGITDPASIKFRNESEILAKSSTPEKLYVEEILPQKLMLGLSYANNITFLGDIKIIINTLLRIIHFKF